MIRANYRSEVGEFVIIENETNRVVADADITHKTALEFGYVRVLERDPGAPAGWSEVIYWDSAEWRQGGAEAFEAILGVIAKVARGGTREETMTKKATAPKGNLPIILESRFARGQQDHQYEAYYTFRGEKLHVFIRCDSYDFQSWAKCEIYDVTTKKWNTLTTVPFSRMKAINIYTGRPLTEVEEGRFHADEDELLRLAALVLS